jgi:hypothetical protein
MHIIQSDHFTSTCAGSGKDGQQQEFGWDLDFVSPDEGCSALQLLGVGGAEGEGAEANGRGGGEPSPAELRALAAQGVHRVEQQQLLQAAAGGSFSLFQEEEDLGEEYEEGKRLREVSGGGADMFVYVSIFMLYHSGKVICWQSVVIRGVGSCG